jgi:ABC-type branched-subunit amino acid transport system substrate-binding protein
MRTRKFTVILLVLVAALSLSVAFTQAQDMTVIKIASQSPLSGPQSVLGISIRNSVELAIEQLGGPLTDMGYTLEFVPFDDQATPDVGVANAQQIVNDPDILAVIGHLNSGVAIPSSEVYNDNDLVMISPAIPTPPLPIAVIQRSIVFAVVTIFRGQPAHVMQVKNLASPVSTSCTIPQHTVRVWRNSSRLKQKPRA